MLWCTLIRALLGMPAAKKVQDTTCFVSKMDTSIVVEVGDLTLIHAESIKITVERKMMVSLTVNPC